MQIKKNGYMLIITSSKFVYLVTFSIVSKIQTIMHNEWLRTMKYIGNRKTHLLSKDFNQMKRLVTIQIL